MLRPGIDQVGAPVAVAVGAGGGAAVGAGAMLADATGPAGPLCRGSHPLKAHPRRANPPIANGGNEKRTTEGYMLERRRSNIPAYSARRSLALSNLALLLREVVANALRDRVGGEAEAF